MQDSDTTCLPCPKNTFTERTGSTSLADCKVKRGFYYKGIHAINLDQIRKLEQLYDFSTDSTLSEACTQEKSLLWKKAASIASRIYSASLAQCKRECMRNLYCTGIIFFKGKRSLARFTAISAEATYNTHYWNCLLQFFEEPSIEIFTPTGKAKVVFSVPNLQEDRCPLHSYCPGGIFGEAMKCPPFSSTQNRGAYSIEHCLCEAGAETAKGTILGGCQLCPLGYYKNITANSPCVACPDSYTTSIEGAMSAYECACAPGYYYVPPLPHTPLTPHALNGSPSSSLPSLSSSSAVYLQLIAEVTRSQTGVPVGTHPPFTPSPSLSPSPFPPKEDPLTRVVDLGRCMPCLPHSYCPGLWGDPEHRRLHKLPQPCPKGSDITTETRNAETMDKCLCLPGYGQASEVAGIGSEDPQRCTPCLSGTYKRSHENTPCTGICMRSASSIEGAIYASQCFCDVGYYMVRDKKEPTLLSCQACIEGAVCPGGLRPPVMYQILSHPTFSDIHFADHIPPFPKKGYFGSLRYVKKQLSKLLERLETAYVEVNYRERTSVGLRQRTLQPEMDRMALDLYEDRFISISPCPNPTQCTGGINEACKEGARGYLCGECQQGYDKGYFESSCIACSQRGVLFGRFFLARLVLYLLTAMLVYASYNSQKTPMITHGALLRIWLNFIFFMTLYGTLPSTTASSLDIYIQLYQRLFAAPFLFLGSYFPFHCVLAFTQTADEAYQRAWYSQRILQMSLPLLDCLFYSFFTWIFYLIFLLLHKKRIQQVTKAIAVAKEEASSYQAIERVVSQMYSQVLWGMMHYLFPEGTSTKYRLRRFFQDLIPAYNIILFLHFPLLFVEFVQMSWCRSDTQNIAASDISMLLHLPSKLCNAKDSLFLLGVSLSSIGLLILCGLVAAWFFYELIIRTYQTVNRRLKLGFLLNGYRNQYCYYEAIQFTRKALIAVTLAAHVQLSPRGPSEYFKITCSLFLTSAALIAQLLLQPLDSRSYNLLNTAETFGLIVNLITALIFQGAYIYSFFKYVGLIPIALTITFHFWMLWMLLVEGGRFVIMRPSLVHLPVPWGWFNRLVRSLARMYIRGTAKVFYNYLTQDIVVEASVQRTWFRFSSFYKPQAVYLSVKKSMREYFCSIIAESMLHLVLTLNRDSIPGDWLDFTMRYAFAYCYWYRHQAAVMHSARVPRDVEELLSLKPSAFTELFSDSYSIRKSYQLRRGLAKLLTRSSNADARATTERNFVEMQPRFGEAEEEVINMMFDTAIFDDSAISLSELYIGVQSMFELPGTILLGLHARFQQKLSVAEFPTYYALLAETHEKEESVKFFGKALSEKMDVDPQNRLTEQQILKFCLTLERLVVLEEEKESLYAKIAGEKEAIRNRRSAAALAQRIKLNAHKQEGFEITTDDRVDITALEEEKKEDMLLELSRKTHRRHIQLVEATKTLEKAPSELIPLERKGTRWLPRIRRRNVRDVAEKVTQKRLMGIHKPTKGAAAPSEAGLESLEKSQSILPTPSSPAEETLDETIPLLSVDARAAPPSLSPSQPDAISPFLPPPDATDIIEAIENKDGPSEEDAAVSPTTHPSPRRLRVKQTPPIPQTGRRIKKIEKHNETP
ncbi:GCC2 and GCC3 domain-containing protein [Cardiosporidium cionae]|uniref:GCC2 and GCC3 domain-containing protein n=1 Tax=Cardiosporidium cionae TaxID=476202 RepID=A0ABQ7J6A6_9APIC|nr:GCC2 and GCC3 domain-containing protein [Cardiosporidium cionae]|eukprot:KAF8819220.1 GCC2 and GCC3 domain-containing protein [Cardiosporidium cionae]